MSTTRSSRNKTLSTLVSSTSSSSSYTSSRYKATKVESASRHSSSIVIEFGSASIKVGIAGEAQPRCIIPSTASISTSASASANHHDPSRTKSTTSLVSSSSVFVVATPPLPTSSMQQSLITHINKTYTENGNKKIYFHSHLSPFLHNLYTDKLYLKPKSRRVIILLPIHYPDEYKDVIENILLRELSVPSIKFISWSSLYTVIPFALGRNVGLVVDIGFMEGRIGAFFNRDVLVDTIQVINVGKYFLTNKICEEVLIQCQEGDSPVGIDIQVLKSIVDDVLTSSSNYQAYSFSSLNIDYEKVQSIVDATIHDLYFDIENPQSLIYAFFSCLMKCPIDIRSELVRNVCFIGGVVLCVPQFERRFLDSVKDLFEEDVISTDNDENNVVGFKIKNARYSKFGSLASLLMDKGPLSLLYPLPFSPSCINWVGGSVLGALNLSNDDGWISREA